MKYPRKDHCLIFKRTGPDQVVVRNYLLNKEYAINECTARFLRKLNGKRDPYKLAPGEDRWSIREVLEDFDDCGLLCDEKRFFPVGIGSFLFTLFRLDNLPAICKVIAKIWNLFLMVACIPMLVFGIIIANSGAVCVNGTGGKGEFLIGTILGTASALLFHEIGHACSCLSYKGHLFEAGVGMSYFLPMAYVLIDYDNVKERRKRVQILAAGIETNLILYGVFMCLCLFPSGLFSTFELYLAAVTNLGIAIFNAFPLKGVDGLKILSEATGHKEELYEFAKRLVNNKLIRASYLRRRGIKGKLSLVASYSLVGFQIVFPCMLILDVVFLFRIIIL